MSDEVGFESHLSSLGAASPTATAVAGGFVRAQCAVCTDHVVSNTMDAMTALETRSSDAYTNDRAHVFHSWSAQGALKPVVVAGGQGSWFWDDQGNRYLDFS